VGAVGVVGWSEENIGEQSRRVVAGNACKKAAPRVICTREGYMHHGREVSPTSGMSTGTGSQQFVGKLMVESSYLGTKRGVENPPLMGRQLRG
ncbi:unnamed protein product, partial [Allacma fusca]